MLSDDGRKHLDTSRNLITNFDALLIEDDELRIKVKDRDAYIKAGVVLAFAVHTHRLGEIVLDLVERDTSMVLVLPSVRACYETALTAHWIAQSADAAVALFNEEIRQRRNLAKTLRSASSSAMVGFADRVAHADLPDALTSSSAQAKSVERMLKDFDGVGTDAYAYYRLLSGYSHAGGSLADQYLEEHPTSPFTLRLEPSDPITPDIGVYLIGCCLVWAGSAARYIQHDPKRRRQELRNAATKLGISPDLHLGPEALHRQPRKR
ncbi:hypothetical protein [Nocardia amamiensis]|uniref:hypothetical protein n=1 Tax=Nocardia amamiensis TaxID=404578 RepID=UPI00082EE6BC|nr:hypothetical protein [Nocardia amamiensis]